MKEDEKEEGSSEDTLPPFKIPKVKIKKLKKGDLYAVGYVQKAINVTLTIRSKNNGKLLEKILFFEVNSNDEWVITI